MSLNWAMLDAQRAPLPLPEESFLEVEHGAHVTLSLNSSGTEPSKQFREICTVHVSKQRLLFVSDKPNETFTSLSVPLLHILEVAFKQPYFIGNYIAIKLRPVEGGGLVESPTIVELRLSNKGMFDFATTLQKLCARAAAIYRRDRAANVLPMYMPPDNATQTEITVTVPDETLPNESELPPAYSIQ